jgi:GT2 family glycosyltransferase
MWPPRCRRSPGSRRDLLIARTSRDLRIWLDAGFDIPHVAVNVSNLELRADDYHAVGGFDPEFPLNYNDIDMCLKLRQKGKRIVYQPHLLWDASFLAPAGKPFD